MTASRRVPKLPTDSRFSSSSFDRWNERCSGVVAELNGDLTRGKSVRFATDGRGGPLCRVYEIPQEHQNDSKQQGGPKTLCQDGQRSRRRSPTITERFHINAGF